MADWTSLDPNTLLPGDPLTSAIVLALEENPRALAEQAVGAPKIADKTLAGTGGTVTFASLDDYKGIFIRGGHEGGGVIGLSHSTDGVTFTGSVIIADAVGAGNNHNYFEVFFDFATGAFKSVYSSGGSAVAVGSLSGTSTGSSLDIVSVRISGTGDIAAFAVPQGGESA